MLRGLWDLGSRFKWPFKVGGLGLVYSGGLEQYLYRSCIRNMQLNTKTLNPQNSPNPKPPNPETPKTPQTPKPPNPKF